MDKLCTLGLVQNLKNNNFILESKMVEINQNKNSKQQGRSVVVWKLHYAWEINQ